jgi:Methyltransferase domain
VQSDVTESPSETRHLELEFDVAGYVSAAAYDMPEHLVLSAWLEHAPFGAWVVEQVRPKVVVELGTETGFSYFVFCQAVERAGLATRCFAIDTWEGDDQTGFYGPEVYDSVTARNRRYSGFSTLVRATFDEGSAHFAAGSIDLLHIDGLHTYESALHDFEHWLPKLSEQAVVLFHDTNVHDKVFHDKVFGVWRLWSELTERYPHFEFPHGNGLGVLGVGSRQPVEVSRLLSAEGELAGEIRKVYGRLGAGVADREAVESLKREAVARVAELERVRSEAATARADLSVSRSEALSLEVARGEAEESAKRSQMELDFLKNSTWWRLGGPIRTSVTELRGVARPRSERGLPLQSVGGSLVRAAKPMIPINLRRAIVTDFPGFARKVKAIQTSDATSSVDDLIGNAFPLLRPLRAFPTPTKHGRRLTLVTDSINKGSLFGGVGTSIVLVSQLAQRLEASLRIVTRLAPPNPANFGIVLRAQEVEFDQDVEFAFVPVGGHESLELHDRDLFLTTSWWSTWSSVRAVAPERIVYLIQEDERLFYPAGDEQAACSETIADSRIRFVVNTVMLRDHFVEEGFSNIGRRGIAFEPAFPEGLYFREAQRADDPRRRFFFYARPNNVRNLFLHGLAAIDEAIAADILDPVEWRFHFVGSGIPSIQLNRGVVPIVSENLPWPEYAALIRRVDVGLSLMSTPHPSYPPLDLAACGAVAITNRFGAKQDLDRYSSNIVCTDLRQDSIVEGIATAVMLAQDGDSRERNYATQQLSRSWDSSLREVLDELSDWG